MARAKIFLLCYLVSRVVVAHRRLSYFLMQDFATSTTYKALPEGVLQVLQRSTLDTLGLATIGSQSQMAQISHGKRWAQVSILMQNGIRHDAAPRTPRGNTDQPLTNAEISDKFHLFSDPVIGSKTAEPLKISAPSLTIWAQLRYKIFGYHPTQSGGVVEHSQPRTTSLGVSISFK